MTDGPESDSKTPTGPIDETGGKPTKNSDPKNLDRPSRGMDDFATDERRSKNIRGREKRDE